MTTVRGRGLRNSNFFFILNKLGTRLRTSIFLIKVDRDQFFRHYYYYYYYYLSTLKMGFQFQRTNQSFFLKSKAKKKKKKKKKNRKSQPLVVVVVMLRITLLSFQTVERCRRLFNMTDDKVGRTICAPNFNEKASSNEERRCRLKQHLAHFSSLIKRLIDNIVTICVHFLSVTSSIMVIRHTVNELLVDIEHRLTSSSNSSKGRCSSANYRVEEGRGWRVCRQNYYRRTQNI
ncbi:hypothetical protein T10_4469 [Trichinella papuae]|uniref:Uncharacterized protein n=1 Tax=Trichinella papuae TaxID=268474 RepID=A0A0V1N7A2_9BILA|nr:hypothetical protein T10_4469 [Trichinella papuae]